MKNSTDRRDLKSVLVLPGICWCACYYVIQHSIYNNFSIFRKNLENKKQSKKKKKKKKKNQPLIMAASEIKKKNSILL